MVRWYHQSTINAISYFYIQKFLAKTFKHKLLERILRIINIKGIEKGIGKFTKPLY